MWMELPCNGWIGKLRWRYRLKYFVGALYQAWQALRGYHVTRITDADPQTK